MVKKLIAFLPISDITINCVLNFRRFTVNKELFQKLVNLAKKSSTAEPRWALGGNAPVIGSRLAAEGAEVLLGAKMSSK